MQNRVYLATLMGLMLGAVSVQAQGWGDLTATFLIDGTAPKPKPLTINKDEAVCGKLGLVDESLVVNADQQRPRQCDCLFVRRSRRQEAPDSRLVQGIGNGIGAV